MQATKTGNLGKASIALIVPKSKVNLLRLMNIIKAFKGSFRGTEHELVVFTSNDQVILRGLDHGDGFWRCTFDDLCEVAALAGSTVSALQSSVVPDAEIQTV